MPRHGDAREHGGWLLVLVAGHERTALHVFDAADIEADPVTVARLPHYAFPGFHGSFTRRVAK